jgi:hypothetical protein
MNRFLTIITIALSIMLVYGIILFFIIKESKECDEHVVLTDETQYDCRNVSSFSNGMSCIKFCDGKEMIVPTVRIKEVRKK